MDKVYNDHLFYVLQGNLSLKEALLHIKDAQNQGAIYLTLNKIEPAFLPHLKRLIQQSIF